MTNIHTLKDISGGSSLSELLLNCYPLSQVELIEQLSHAKKIVKLQLIGQSGR